MKISIDITLKCFRNYFTRFIFWVRELDFFIAQKHILISSILPTENWLNYYNLEKRKSATRQPQHDLLIMKLVKICSVINHVVGGFVIRDITILLAKWLKRGGSWVNE